MKELHENSLQLCFDDAAFTELTRIVISNLGENRSTITSD